MTAIITLIAAITALVVAVTALIKLFQQGTKVQELHVLINSRMTELLKLTQDASFAKGQKSEADKQ
jgi:hypothetical protein